MTYKALIAFLFVVGLAFFSTSCATPATKYVEIDSDIALYGACEADGTYSHATVTRLGSAYVTANHWADHPACRAAKLEVARKFPVEDIAILQPGSPGECRDAEIGESVVFVGWPTRPAVAGFPEEAALETDTGLVLAHDFPVAMSNGIVLFNTSTASSNKVRFGYSGGPVVSARDGRIVGIINAVGTRETGETYTAFTPVSRVCALLERINEQVSN